MMIKKLLVTLFAGLFLISLAACGQTSNKAQTTSKTSEKTYQQYVSDLEEITIDQLNQKIANSETFMVYLGRETCPYCNIFVPKLAEAHKDKPVTIYYVDTEKTKGQTLDDFVTHFSIKTVPNFSYFANKEKADTLHKGSETSVEEIKAFLEKYGK